MPEKRGIFLVAHEENDTFLHNGKPRVFEMSDKVSCDILGGGQLAEVVSRRGRIGSGYRNDNVPLQ